MTTVNNRTLSGIISLSDGAGSTIENGKVITNVVDSGHLMTDTSEIGSLEIDRLWLQEHLQVDGLFITPTWLSFLYGLTSNVQTQINGIASSLLAGANTWTGAQIFQGNVVNTAWRGTSSAFPSYTSTSIGAIFGRSVYNKAMSFLNSNTDLNITTPAFVWSKMDSSSSDIELLKLSNNGTLTATGNMSSPNITNMTNNISALQTGKQNLIDTSNRLDSSLVGTGVVSNAEFNTLDGVTSAIQPQIDGKQATLSVSNRLDAALVGTGVVDNTEFGFLDGVTSSIQNQLNILSSSISAAAILSVANLWTSTQSWAAGTRIDIQGSTANATWPTRSSAGAGSIWCRGSTTYNMALSFVNTNSNATAGSRAFVWTKQTGVSSGTDLLRINNDGSAAFTGDVTVPTINFNRSIVAVDQTNLNTTYTWDSLPTYTVLTGSCNITLPNGVTTPTPGATWNITLRGNFTTTINVSGGHTIWYGGSSNTTLVFASSNQSRTLFTNGLGEWTVLLQ